MADVADTELLDYEEEEQTAGGDAAATGDAAAANGTNGAGKLTVQYDLKSDMYFSRNMQDNVKQIQQLCKFRNPTISAKTEGKKDAVKGTYVSIHSSGFRDFLLKPEILRAIVDCGFEHPSEGE